MKIFLLDWGSFPSTSQILEVFIRGYLLPRFRISTSAAMSRKQNGANGYR
jgi:hypothetical protein